MAPRATGRNGWKADIRARRSINRRQPPATVPLVAVGTGKIVHVLSHCLRSRLARATKTPSPSLLKRRTPTGFLGQLSGLASHAGPKGCLGRRLLAAATDASSSQNEKPSRPSMHRGSLVLFFPSAMGGKRTLRSVEMLIGANGFPLQVRSDRPSHRALASASRRSPCQP